MMGMTTKITGAIVAVMFMASSSYAEISKQQAQKLLEESGSLEIIKETPYVVPMSLIQSAENEGKNVSPTTKKKLLKKSLAIFNETALIEQYTQGLMHGLNEDDYQSLIAWYESKLGKNLVRQDVYYNSRVGFTKLVELMENGKVDSKRVVLLDQIMKVSFQDKYLLQMLEAMLDGMILGFQAQNNNQLAAEDIAMFRSVMLKQMKRTELINMRKEMTKEYVFIYANFTEAELNTYLAKLKTDAFQKFYQVSLDSSAPEMNEYISRIMEETMYSPELIP